MMRAAGNGWPRAGVALVVFATLAGPFAARSARADAVDVCVRAADDGQAARRSTLLSAARREFIACASEACPGPIRADCLRWLGDVEARLPSVSLRILSPDGRDVRGATFVDGERRPEAETGRLVALDPGLHRFRVEAAGFADATADVMLIEGERARVVTVSMAPVARDAPPPSRAASGPGPLVWTAGALSVVALGSFAYFGLTGDARGSELENGCGRTQTCAPHDVSSVRTRYLVADVSLGVSAIALGVALAAWLLQAKTPGASRR